MRVHSNLVLPDSTIIPLENPEYSNKIFYAITELDYKKHISDIAYSLEIGGRPDYIDSRYPEIKDYTPQLIEIPIIGCPTIATALRTARGYQSDISPDKQKQRTVLLNQLILDIDVLRRKEELPGFNDIAWSIFVATFTCSGDNFGEKAEIVFSRNANYIICNNPRTAKSQTEILCSLHQGGIMIVRHYPNDNTFTLYKNDNLGNLTTEEKIIKIYPGGDVVKQALYEWSLLE